jgi:hypothetical protein
VVIKALEEWRPELEGSSQRFDIITDHKNLQTFATTKQLSPCHIQWSEFLARFNFRIGYRPESAHARADALSKKPEHMPQGIEDNRLRNRKRPLIQPECFDPETFSLSQLCLVQLNVSRHIDELLAEMYANTVILQAMIEALGKPGIRA